MEKFNSLKHAICILPTLFTEEIRTFEYFTCSTIFHFLYPNEPNHGQTRRDIPCESDTCILLVSNSCPFNRTIHVVKTRATQISV